MNELAAILHDYLPVAAETARAMLRLGAEPCVLKAVETCTDFEYAYLRYSTDLHHGGQQRPAVYIVPTGRNHSRAPVALATWGGPAEPPTRAGMWFLRAAQSQEIAAMLYAAKGEPDALGAYSQEVIADVLGAVHDAIVPATTAAIARLMAQLWERKPSIGIAADALLDGGFATLRLDADLGPDPALWLWAVPREDIAGDPFLLILDTDGCVCHRSSAAGVALAVENGNFRDRRPTEGEMERAAWFVNAIPKKPKLKKW